MADQGAIALTESLANYPYLKRLCLASNRIESKGGEVILEVLLNHPTLLYLDLGIYKSTSDMHELPNNMGDNTVPALCHFLRNNKKLQHLSLRDNNISLSGIERLANALQDNNSLVKFDYEQFGLTLPKHLRQRIREKLEENINNTLGLSGREFQKDYVRYLKHDKAVCNIDSIYRNKSCTL